MIQASGQTATTATGDPAPTTEGGIPMTSEEPSSGDVSTMVGVDPGSTGDETTGSTGDDDRLDRQRDDRLDRPTSTSSSPTGVLGDGLAA